MLIIFVKFLWTQVGREKSRLSIFEHVHSAYHAACLNIQERFNSNSKPSAGFYGTKKDRCIVQRSFLDKLVYPECLRKRLLLFGSGCGTVACQRDVYRTITLLRSVHYIGCLYRWGEWFIDGQPLRLLPEVVHKRQTRQVSMPLTGNYHFYVEYAGFCKRMVEGVNAL